jgi:RNA 3'-phosphate cyclase
MMKKLGVETTMCIGRRGHYPKGGGRISCDIEPLLRAQPIQYHFDEPLKISCICGRAHAVRLPCHIPERMIDAAITTIEAEGYTIGAMESECPEPKYDPHLGPGTGITLWACTNNGTILSGDALGKKGVPAEEVGKEAAENLLAQLKTNRPIDYHLADQLILWMAVSPFPSIIDTTKITLHTLTNVEIAKLITDAEFTISGKQGQPGIISCEPKLMLDK